MMTIIPHWLDKQAELNPDGNAFETPNGEGLTFQELRERSRSMAFRMKAAGVKDGDHVAFLHTNDLQYPVFIHAISYIGAVVVLINTRLTAPEIRYQLEDAHINHFFIGEAFEQTARTSVQGLDIIVHRLGSLPVAQRTSGLKGDLNFEDVYTMMYTSGTTGRPKAVMHTYGNHWYSAVASSLNLGLHSDDKWLTCLPFFHVGGFSLLMKSVIYGMPVYLLKKFDASVVNRAIKEDGVTHASVVTVMLQRLLEEMGESRYPSSFRCMLLGGGPVPESILRKSEDRYIPVFQTYGMTETSSQIATLSPKSALAKMGSAGKALSMADLVIDSHQNGEVGEILVKGPMVSKGYYNRDRNAETYLRTGDLGYKDDDGFLYVVDRLKDVIISGGENVYPAEIESVLTSIPGIKEAGVTGRRDATWGEVPVAFLVGDKATGDKKITDYCLERLGKFKVPAQFYWVDELPRNASNKLLRRKLLSLVEEGNV
ncbi:o-succinylbenzoate--CoA ligase [Bacillus sp. SB49]|uniref:o-succinylbenzoate--CoA ligase n=1 Tax=Bacillus sp. SB49 TaxID=1071080 RepID=UPI0004192AFB|nr:o-succinylbenzoate--CoA ligase [Bacillus sp. SB49]QHT47481.1 o-succinylbenzoate--CoA ligase [Bacillus sp. SB49]